MRSSDLLYEEICARPHAVACFDGFKKNPMGKTTGDYNKAWHWWITRGLIVAIPGKNTREAMKKNVFLSPPRHVPVHAPRFEVERGLDPQDPQKYN